jgi:pyruvate,orthophosphate dikinase
MGWVFGFGDGRADGGRGMEDRLGGKGAGLAEMSRLGLPVPPGFTIATDVCMQYLRNGRRFPDDLAGQVTHALVALERNLGSRFGDAADPLLLAVRSGARASMPGMMDTVLNLGLNDVTVIGLAARSGNDRFAWDSYRRFIQMYGNVVSGIAHHRFEDILEQAKDVRRIERDTDFDAADWQAIVAAYKDLVQDETGEPFPQDVHDQLWGAVGAVFRSWNSPRAIAFRVLYDIPEEGGTAVTIQAMVFGNMGDDCATGVAHTRNPSTGENVLCGEFLINAQGEDVVAGLRTPHCLTRAERLAGCSEPPSLEEAMPEAFHRLQAVRTILERHYRDLQEIEFTVQRNRLYVLQTRSARCSPDAAIRIAVELCREGLIDRTEAVSRVDPALLAQVRRPVIDPQAPRTVIVRGLPASPGVATGYVVFDAEEAADRSERGETVILVRKETSPNDVRGMCAAAGILTGRGGVTSHAAVIARGMGKPCITGAADLRFDPRVRAVRVGTLTIRDGDLLTIDGTTGEVMLGRIPTIDPELSPDAVTLLTWAESSSLTAV